MTFSLLPLLRGALIAAALTVAAAPAFASLERARAAQARGDLRAAQIELRNAVRGAPNDAALRMALAQASLDVGDADTAEREARAAIERGFDRAAATAVLIRAQLGLNRARDVLREFPEPAAGTDPALAAQILSGRALAHLSLGQQPEARQAAEAAVRAGPRVLDAQLVLAAVLNILGDRAGAEAAVDRALQIDPASQPAQQQKAAFHFNRGELPQALALLDRVTTAAPGNAMARLQRAEVLLRQGNDQAATAEVDAALRLQPGSVPANFLRAMLQVRAQDWRGADETLSRLGAALPNLPEGLLLQATVKRQLNQSAQALDAAQRYVARQPQDPRGARLLAGLELEAGQPAAAVATLQNMIARGQPDAESLDMLGMALMRTARPREAADAFRRAAELAPNNPAVLQRLAAARLSIGDMSGMAEAAQAALAADARGPATRLMLAMAAMARGEVAAAEAELGQLDAEARNGEPARVLAGMIRLARFDAAGARAGFEAVLRDHPESVPARIGLARVASVQGRPEEAERLLGEVLARDPANQEAIGRLLSTVVARGPRSAPSRAVLEAAQRAHPQQPALAFALATGLTNLGEHDQAAALLQSEALRGAANLRAPVALRLSEVRAAQEDWAAAEAAARTALAENPNFNLARRQLAGLLARRGDARGAEALIEDGLRVSPADPVLLGTAVTLAQQTGGVEAALARAAQLEARPGALPAAATLRGDVLMGARRPAEAAEAYAQVAQRAPSSVLAVRQASALVAANRPADAVTVLETWLAREPNDAQAMSVLGQIALQMGRPADAERHFRGVVERAPQDAVALNNLAWLLHDRGGDATREEARQLAERAFFIAPTAEIADTLGWILARGGDLDRAVPLLRQAAAGAAAGNAPAAPGIAYRLAHALREAGQREEAVRVLEPVLAQDRPFPERAQAERLMTELRGAR